MRRTVLVRWALVAVVAVVLVSIPAVVAAWPAPGATAADPAQLREQVAASGDAPFTGYAESRGALALPSIGVLSDVTSVLAGVTRMRAWYDGPERSRTDQLSPIGERNRYVTPDGQAVWDYGANLLTLVDDDPTVRLPRPDDVLPPQLARRLLSGTDPADAVTALEPRRIAGVSAAGMRVEVGDTETTVEALDVWADPASGLPVRVEVHARGSTSLDGEGPPALATEFVELEQGPPDPEALVPRRAPGTGITRSPTSDLFGVLGRGSGQSLPTTVAGRDREPPQDGFDALGQYGTTLGQMIVVPLPPDIAGTLLDGIERASAGSPMVVSEGAEGAMLESGLLTLGVVRDGERAWSLSGLVEPVVIERGAADVLDGVS